MSLRTTLTGDSTWHQIGTGPATVQVISPDANQVAVMVVCATAQPTGNDGMVLSSEYPVHLFSVSQAIWAQVVEAGQSALLAVQPEVFG
jgi:hypothetical protein